MYVCLSICDNSKNNKWIFLKFFVWLGTDPKCNEQIFMIRGSGHNKKREVIDPKKASCAIGIR